jgi:hypothetical protein
MSNDREGLESSPELEAIQYRCLVTYYPAIYVPKSCRHIPLFHFVDGTYICIYIHMYVRIYNLHFFRKFSVQG